MTAFTSALRPLLFPAPALLDRKLDEHRRLSVAMSLMCAFTAVGLWVWDRAVDVEGARGTLGLRCSFLALFLLYALVTGGVRPRRLVALAGLLQAVCGEAVFVLILDRLDAGMIHGIGGFLFFFMAPLVLFQGLSLGLNLLYTVLAAGLPHALALLGAAPGFPHLQYAVLVWPAALVTAAAQVAFARNYLLRYESERRLEMASYTDALTGVSNRRHFMPHLAQEMSRCRRFQHTLSLLMLDIDRFKLVNDTFGHPTGDEVIRCVAEACRSRSRESDLVARLGGEEFAVLLPEDGLEGALAYAERIREDVERLVIPVPGREAVRCTVSIGVAELGPGDRTEDDLLRRGDGALYRAKAGGRNRVCR